MKQENNNWVEEFDKLLPMDVCNDGEYSDEEMTKCMSSVLRAFNERTKSFISNLLEAQRQALIKEIEKKQKLCYEKDRPFLEQGLEIVGYAPFGDGIIITVAKWEKVVSK